MEASESTQLRVGAPKALEERKVSGMRPNDGCPAMKMPMTVKRGHVCLRISFPFELQPLIDSQVWTP